MLVNGDGDHSEKGVNAACINFTQLAVQWKYTLAHWPRFCTPFCQYCLRMAVIISHLAFLSLSTIKVGVMFWKFSKHRERSYDFSFTVRSTQWKKTNEDSVIFRRITEVCPRMPKNPEKEPKMFRSYIIYIPESRVQSPESRVQSSPESSPGFRLSKS